MWISKKEYQRLVDMWTHFKHEKDKYKSLYEMERVESDYYKRIGDCNKHEAIHWEQEYSKVVRGAANLKKELKELQEQVKEENKMIIHEQVKKEVIKVFHNSSGEMRDNVAALQKEGWSENTRHSVTGVTLSRLTLYGDDLEWMRENHPNVVIQEPTDSILYDRPYVYYTEHERVIKEEE